MADLVIHSCKGVPVTVAAQERASATCWRSECRAGCYYPGACSERAFPPGQPAPPARDVADGSGS